MISFTYDIVFTLEVPASVLILRGRTIVSYALELLEFRSFSHLDQIHFNVISVSETYHSNG